MFGYVRAVTSVLSPEDAQRYEAVYCGLCRTLGNRYGKTAQLILNYDFVFLALLLAKPEGEGTFPCCPCPVHPWRKKTCWLGSPALDEAADATVILTWWKLQDAIRDGGLWSGEEPGSCLALRRRTAAARRPAFDHTVQTCLEELHQLEVANTPPWTSRRTPLPTSSRQPAPRPAAARTHGVEQILYHVGGGSTGRRLGRPGPGPKGGELQPPPGPVRRPGGDGRAPSGKTMHVSLGLPKPLFLCWTGASGKGCWGTSYPPACRRWRRQCLPASGKRETVPFTIIKGPRSQRTHAIRRTIAYERSLCRVGCEPIRQ